VVRNPVRRQHAKGNVLATTPLDPAARTLAERVGVQQQHDHHRRLERGSTPAVLPIGAVDGAQIDLLDGVEHEPGEVILRQPLAQAWRQQQLLVAITRKEVLSHRATSGRQDAQRIVLASPDDNPRRAGVCATASNAGLVACAGVHSAGGSEARAG
jgi:hypothetical protein